MIITKLMGGLGNQMFQYAAGRSLSVKLNSGLKTDRSFLERDPTGAYTLRHYELDMFNCIQERVSSEDLKNIREAQKKNLFSSIRSAFLKNKLTVFNEKGPTYDQTFEGLQGNVYLNGYWQSEKYFLAIRDLLLKEFSLRPSLSKEAEILQNQILSNERSVSLHFRRGDYINLASASSYHGTKGLDYYTKALEILTEKIGTADCFIFSDDINWVKENFKPANATYVTGLKNMEDLELMKTCRHNITANSSFSWWGAWLNDHKDKIVISPKQWFNDPAINTSDLIPSAWLRV